ncbi:hypothetical protein ACROYT_G040201 [Oculina patagonica]
MDPRAEVPLAFLHGSGPATNIEFYAEIGGPEFNILNAVMLNLSATRHMVYDMVDNIKTISPCCSYKTTQPPYLVLNRLESQAGYKVVASNSAPEHTGQVNPGRPMAFDESSTFIEFYADELQGRQGDIELTILQDVLAKTGAMRCFGKKGSRYSQSASNESPYYSYTIAMPPYLVLNRLESQAGYKVVASNSFTHNNGFHFQMWTLQKQA